MRTATRILCSRCKAEIETDLTVDFKSLSSIPVCKWRTLPPISAVYFIVGGSPSSPTVYYVGQSRNLRQRWSLQIHRERAKQTVADAHIAWMATSIKRLKETEQAAICQFAPRWNRYGTEYLSPDQVVKRFPIQMKMLGYRPDVQSPRASASAMVKLAS